MQATTHTSPADARAVMNDFDSAASSRPHGWHARMPYALWATQGLLAVLFVFAGATKWILPAEDLTEQFPLAFMRFIGVCEMLGGIGMVVPGVLRIRRGLTPLAAAGLVIIMIGATVSTAVDRGIAPALLPFVVGLLAAFVAYGRRAWFAEPIA